jgi:hypothetical protein
MSPMWTWLCRASQLKQKWRISLDSDHKWRISSGSASYEEGQAWVGHTPVDWKKRRVRDERRSGCGRRGRRRGERAKDLVADGANRPCGSDSGHGCRLRGREISCAGGEGGRCREIWARPESEGNTNKERSNSATN